MADPKVINYAGGQKIYNAEKVDQEIDAKITSTIGTVSDGLDAEITRAKAAEGELTDLKTTDKSSLVAAINEVKDSAYTVDKTITAGSTNPVESNGIKEYVDAQDESTLKSAKDYTDAIVGELAPGDGTTVVELTGHLSDLNNAAESLVTAINSIDDHIKQSTTDITNLSKGLADERQARIDGDQALDTKITQVEQAKQDKLTFDVTPTHGSDNPVTSTGIKDYVDTITGQLGDLNTPAESLVTAINQLDNKKSFEIVSTPPAWADANTDVLYLVPDDKGILSVYTKNPDETGKFFELFGNDIITTEDIQSIFDEVFNN